MAIVGIVLIFGFAMLVFVPQWWVKRAISRHSVHREDFPGTGGELASHILKHYGVEGVGVESVPAGDHYDPDAKKIRLSEQHFNGSSLSAIAIAAHEVGHALQDYGHESGLAWRQRLVRLASVTDGIASVFFLVAPVLGVLAKTPLAFFGMASIGIALLAIRVLVHLVTLPVEYDASFGKALPILQEGGYLSDDDIPAAREVLKAAAFTYVSAALLSMLDLARWIRILR